MWDWDKVASNTNNNVDFLPVSVARGNVTNFKVLYLAEEVPRIAHITAVYMQKPKLQYIYYPLTLHSVMDWHPISSARCLMLTPTPYCTSRMVMHV